MSLATLVSNALRKGPLLRIVVAIFIFLMLATFSKYTSSFEFSSDDDGQAISSTSEDASNGANTNSPNSSPLDLHITHHIASYDQSPQDIKIWTRGDARLLLTAEGQAVADQLVSNENPLHPHPSVVPMRTPQGQPLAVHEHATDFLLLTKRQRVYKALWASLLPYYQQADKKEDFYARANVPLEVSTPATPPPTKEDEMDQGEEDEGVLEGIPKDDENELVRQSLLLFQRIEQATYPWLLKHYTSLFDLWSKTMGGGKGIVICVGNSHVGDAMTTVHTLRKVLKSTLPIEIFYNGNDDLSKEYRDWFKNYEDLEMVDIGERLDESLTRIEAHSIKPFAMLLSKFDEVLLMDPDSTFLQDPAVLFQDEGYQAVGTVFFYDRTLFPNFPQYKNWLTSFLPTMSNHPAKTRWFKMTGSFEQESGVVVIDKRQHFASLLAICKMNDFKEREVTYEMTYHDKESWWIGFEIMQEQYSFLRYNAGAIGDFGEVNQEVIQPGSGRRKPVMKVQLQKDRICGSPLHFTALGQPLWWNAGLKKEVEDAKRKTKYMKFVGYLRDEHGTWDTADSFCLIQNHPNAVKEVEWQDRQLIFDILGVDQKVAQEIKDPNIKVVLEIPELVKTEGARGGRGNGEIV